MGFTRLESQEIQLYSVQRISYAVVQEACSTGFPRNCWIRVAEKRTLHLISGTARYARYGTWTHSLRITHALLYKLTGRLHHHL